MPILRCQLVGSLSYALSSLVLLGCAGADGGRTTFGGPGIGGVTASEGGAGNGGTATDLGGSGGLGGSIGTGGQPAANGGTSGSECPAGSERCPCRADNTCNSGLVCGSQLCVNLGLGGAASGGASSNGFGGAATGGAATGGNAIGGAGGTSTGGRAAGGAGASTGGKATGGANTSTGGSPVGGLGGAATGGNSVIGTGTGGKAIGGAGGTGTGGKATGGFSATTTGGASATGGASFWKAVTYSSTALPNPSNGNHNAGLNCRQCHDGSTSAPVWMFGGTVYQANGTTPAPNVQVGVNDGTNLYTAYTATNGNFWVAGTATINWAQAQVRIRNGNGETTMAGATPAATCNGCHTGTGTPRITAP
jgi:hypothetical protein